MPFKGLWKSYTGKINSLNTSTIRGRPFRGLHRVHTWQINSLQTWTYDGKSHLIFWMKMSKHWMHQWKMGENVHNNNGI
jgi:hypothetical protein